MNGLISVIIPTYNRQSLLRRSLASVLMQRHAEFEVIVVDDGSADETRQMITAEFPTARYFYQESKGPSAARNLGIQNALGQWIAFLDSDDEWLPGKLEAQANFFRENPEIKICQTEEIWIRNGVRVNPMKKHQKRAGDIFEDSLALCLISPSCAMLDKSLLDEVGLFNESFLACEDYDLWLRITAKHPVGLITKPYVTRYQGHEDQQSQKFQAMDRFRIQSLIHLLESEKLSQKQTEATYAVLEKKAELYAKGLLKREKVNEINEIRESLKSFPPRVAQVVDRACLSAGNFSKTNT